MTLREQFEQEEVGYRLKGYLNEYTDDDYIKWLESKLSTHTTTLEPLKSREEILAEVCRKHNVSLSNGWDFKISTEAMALYADQQRGVVTDELTWQNTPNHRCTKDITPLYASCNHHGNNNGCLICSFYQPR